MIDLVKIEEGPYAGKWAHPPRDRSPNETKRGYQWLLNDVALRSEETAALNAMRAERSNDHDR